ncbi:MAG: glycosyltransferase, partial [Rhodospirillales bacterium]|nr:glycosyltransferase [Rhodospirillales bacterium]
LAASLARQLSDEYRFVFICLDGIGQLGETLASEGFTVASMERKPGVDMSLPQRIRRFRKQTGVQLIHAHQYTPFFYAAASRHIGARPPILFTEHGREYPDRRRPKRVLANKVLIKRRDRVTAVGAYIALLVAQNEGIASRRIEGIYNGIEPADFAPIDRDAARAAARFALQIDADAPLVMQVARFHPVKDHATAIHAFAHLVTGLPDARLVLIGDGERRPQIEALIDDYHIREKVLLAGRRPDVSRLLPAADVFMLSSLSEGISVTLLEAMAAGAPIAATAVGGNVEVVEHGRTGLLSPRGDAAALAENLRLLLIDTNLRHRMADAAHAKLHEQFLQSTMHNAYRRAYDQMLK